MEPAVEQAQSATDVIPSGKPRIVQLTVVAGTENPRIATVTIGFGKRHVTQQAKSPNGPNDAVVQAIKRIVPHEAELEVFRIKTLSSGSAAIGRVTVVIKFEGRRYRAMSENVDITLAFARAYIGALNQTRLMRP